MNANHNGVSLFGGVDCAWAASSTMKPIIGATAIPFKVENASGLAIADLAVEAKDATTGSSIAFIATNAAVSLKRVRLSAGAGAGVATRGDAGTTGVSDKPLVGNDSTTAVGGPEKTCACATSGGTTTGGKGGDNGFDGATGAIVQSSPKPTVATGAGGTSSECGGTTAGGRRGSDAPDGLDGAGAQTPGVLAAQGWTPQRGTVGENGRPGQGGGGGGGTGGSGGGGGGCGGCGGSGGAGGGAGGASIAVASVAATLFIERSELTTGRGGVGGQGGPGGPSMAGGVKGIGGGSGCAGGGGGTGGAGGIGGGGAGGSSVAVVFTKKKPQLDPISEKDAVIGAAASGGAGVSAANTGMTGASGLYLESK